MNLALHEIEKRRRRHEAADSEFELQQAIAPERSDEAAERDELVRCTEEALEALPANWAAVFRLRAFEDLSYAEIAQCLDIPVGTVMSRLARARTRLAEALAQRFGALKERPS